jgi:hypothetical protein
MGGNVFGKSLPIRKQDIKPTLANFFQEWGRIFPNAKQYLTEENIGTLGSAGKRDTSGDIDLALSRNAFQKPEDWGFTRKEVEVTFNRCKGRARSASKEQLLRKTFLTLLAEKIKRANSSIVVDTKATSAGMLFCQFPQYNESGQIDNKRVQIDVNLGDLSWLKFAYNSTEYAGNIKGLHRTALLLILFAYKGYVFNRNAGVRVKDSNKVVARTPQEAVRVLSDAYGIEFTEKDLESYSGMQKFLSNNLDEEERNKVYDKYLKYLDGCACDIPADLENYWLDNQERLGLTGKFLPSSSKLYPFRDSE